MQTNATVAEVLLDHEASINSGWIMSMAFNVLVMQSGFAMLEVSHLCLHLRVLSRLNWIGIAKHVVHMCQTPPAPPRLLDLEPYCQK